MRDKTMDGAFQSVDDDPAAGLSQCSPICFPFIPQGVKFCSNDQGVRLVGQVFFQQRRSIRVIPVVWRQGQFPLFTQPLGSQDIVLTIFPNGIKWRAFGRVVIVGRRVEENLPPDLENVAVTSHQ